VNSSAGRGVGSGALAPDDRGDVAEQLGNLQALTDSTLARLDFDSLLVELLTRVRSILEADTAAVLLLDSRSHELVATAACGIEEEVHQGVRVPVGSGFAGHIAATREPLRLDRVDHTTVANPILWEKGIKAMLGVPLLSADQLIGVLHVGRLDERPFSSHDAELLQVVGERVSGATHAQGLTVERAAAALLERSLLPSRLPSCDGLEFAARYVPAESQVGGDWYDLFTLPSGQLWIVVGDVAGKGLEAAVIMGRVRSALRAYTMLDVPPEVVLELVDRKVSHFEIGTFATVVCAMSDPPYDTLTFALAGHPPPIVAVPDLPATLASSEVGSPLGLGSTAARSSATVELTPGATVAFYTDGLVERRGEVIDVGLGRLCDAVSPRPAGQVAHEIMRRLVGTTAPRDDIALVVLHRTDDH
jgi:sigma-B regulation protein RsbU (phosphoserine phosphatase)